MKRRVDLSSVLFASSTLGLMLLTADCYYREFKESGNIANRPGVILACLIMVVLTIQVIVLLKRKHPVDGSVYILDVDPAGNPEDLHEVSESSIVELCQNDYDMEYNVEKWPDLRELLKLEMEKKSSNAKLAEKLYQAGTELNQRTGTCDMAMLEYNCNSESKAVLVDISEMPSAFDGAARVLLENDSKSLLFHTLHELMAWETHINERNHRNFRHMVYDFIRRREAERELFVK